MSAIYRRFDERLERLLSRNSVRGLLSGMAASVAIYSTHQYVYPHRSTTSALRGDWQRIGADVSRVIAREVEKAQTE